MRVAIIGAGAWGTALANAAALAGHDVSLWMRDAQAAETIRNERANERFLPGIALHPHIRATARADDVRGADSVLWALPAQVFEEQLERLLPDLGDAPLVICAKGLERRSGRFLSDIAGTVRPGAPVAVLSGPGFADDVARGLPTALTLACSDASLAARLAADLSSRALRLYHSDDVRGVEIGGAAKNVLAIACGIVQGRGLGESARAALLARGFAELLRFATAHDACAETLMGLSGLGDVVLSCASRHSRNFAFGERIGQGASVEEASDGTLAEGVFTAAVLLKRGTDKNLEMPVVKAVTDILDGRINVQDAIATLVSRPFKSEIQGFAHGSMTSSCLYIPQTEGE